MEAMHFRGYFDFALGVLPAEESEASMALTD